MRSNSCALVRRITCCVIVAASPCFAQPALSSQAYTALAEPQFAPEAAVNPADQYRQDPTQAHLYKAIQYLVRTRHADTAWTLVKQHDPPHGQYYFKARLAAVNANMARASKLAKLGWARRLKETCTTRFKVAPEDETALECLAKFHHRAPKIAGGDKAMGRQALETLTRINPPRGLLVEAEMVFPKDGPAARALVDKALAYDHVYDEGLMQAAMVYGFFEDWEAAAKALKRVDPASPVASMRHYQLGKLSAELGQQLPQGEAALMQFLTEEDTVYYGVDFRGAAHWRIGQIFRWRERYDLAKLAFERALKYAPKLDAAKKDLKDIEKRLKR